MKIQELTVDVKELAKIILMEQYGFSDQGSNGEGYWVTPRSRIEIISRTEAWGSIGISKAHIGDYTIDFDIAKKMGLNIAHLPCLGLSTALKIHKLNDDDRSKYYKTYDEQISDKNSWAWRNAIEAFQRCYNIDILEEGIDRSFATEIANEKFMFFLESH